MYGEAFSTGSSPTAQVDLGNKKGEGPEVYTEIAEGEGEIEEGETIQPELPHVASCEFSSWSSPTAQVDLGNTKGECPEVYTEIAEGERTARLP